MTYNETKAAEAFERFAKMAASSPQMAEMTILNLLSRNAAANIAGALSHKANVIANELSAHVEDAKKCMVTANFTASFSTIGDLTDCVLANYAS